MNSKLYTLLYLSVLVLFAACQQEDSPVEPIIGNRTVLVYIVADNNGLEESYPRNFASQDIDEMMVGMESVDASSYNLLVYQDDKDTPVLFRISKDGKGKVVKETIHEYEEQVSTDASVMTEVLHRAFLQYPADSYGLVYWSHADGWIPYPLSSASTRWIGQDSGEGDNRMNISDFLTVLKSVPHFDFIMFDACFMMSIEVAYELRHYTDYYMGSPTENPGPGAPYDKVVPQMFVSNAASKMASVYFDYYQSKYNAGVKNSNTNWTGGTSIAVLESSKLDDLAAITNRVLSATADNATFRGNIFDYDKRSVLQGHVGYYDLETMVRELTDNVSFAEWKQAFDASIVYWNTTEKNYSQFAGMFSMKNTNGVTHYIPASTASAAAVAYRSTAWYEAAGLSKLGW